MQQVKFLKDSSFKMSFKCIYSIRGIGDKNIKCILLAKKIYVMV